LSSLIMSVPSVELGGDMVDRTNVKKKNKKCETEQLTFEITRFEIWMGDFPTS
jgi:hypothetical protein